MKSSFTAFYRTVNSGSHFDAFFFLIPILRSGMSEHVGSLVWLFSSHADDKNGVIVAPEEEPAVSKTILEPNQPQYKFWYLL